MDTWHEIKNELLIIATKFYKPGSPEARGIVTAIEHVNAMRVKFGHDPRG